jgi:hypothetical protein
MMISVKRRNRSRVSGFLFVAAAFVSQAGWGQGVPTGSLVDPRLTDSFTVLERRAAIANQAIYNALALPSTPNGTAICSAPGQGECTGAVLGVFNNMQSLVQTAEEVLNGADLPFGMNLDAAALGLALRWTAPEELFALGSMSTQFLSNQLSMVGNRMTANRTTSRSNLLGADLRTLIRTSYASADGGPARPADGGWSRLNMFFDAAGGFGKKADTTNTLGSEDAFDFDGFELTLGMDYRLSDSLVAGGLFGYSDRRVDFDSSLSVVDGHIKSKGYSLIAFMQFDQMRYYASGSLGYQRSNFDTYRRIMFTSLDPGVPSINTAAAGSPDSNALLATLDFGVPLQWKSIGVDLYAKADYQNVKIGGFAEVEAPVTGGSGSGFGFDVSSQTIKSLDTALGIKLQRVWQPDFGILVPYVRMEFHRQLATGRHGFSAVYSDLPDSVSDAIEQSLDSAFRSDAPDKAFYTLAVGASAVLRGSSKISAAGAASGGLQGYLQYATVRDKHDYRDNLISGGLRYEF